MNRKRARFIPALRYDWLTTLYDPMMRLTLRESEFKRRLLDAARIQDGQRILDLACGTATLTLLIKRHRPGTEAIGIDGDLKALSIALDKVAKSGLNLALHCGMVYELPYPDNAFDTVFSSLLFHHLTSENKRHTFEEAHRILRPGGQLCVADWGKPANKLMRLLFLLVQALDGFETTTDNANGLLPMFFRETGFESVQELNQYNTVFGTLRLYTGQKPHA